MLHDADAGVVFTGDAAGLNIPELNEIRGTSPPPQFDLDQARRDVSTIAEL